jgi:tetratricopeptide (TPR) repeat protein
MGEGCKRRALLEQAQQAWDAEDFAAAVNHYETFLRENPESEQAAEIRFRAATICARDLHEYERAIAHFIRLLEDHPDSPDLLNARLRLAECYAAVEKRNEAITEYENLLPLLSDLREKRRLRLQIAELYYEKNDLRQAVVEYQKVATGQEWDDLQLQAALRLAQVAYLRDDLEAAMQSFGEVLDRSQDPAIKRIAQLGMVDCYERVLRFDDALAFLQKIDVDPAVGTREKEQLQRRMAEMRERQRQRLNAPENPETMGRGSSLVPRRLPVR